MEKENVTDLADLDDELISSSQRGSEYTSVNVCWIQVGTGSSDIGVCEGCPAGNIKGWCPASKIKETVRE